MRERKSSKIKLRQKCTRQWYEVGTGICQDVEAAYQEIFELRTSVSSIAKELGYSIGASGTHPFSLWETQIDFGPKQVPSTFKRITASC